MRVRYKFILLNNQKNQINAKQHQVINPVLFFSDCKNLKKIIPGIYKLILPLNKISFEEDPTET